MSLARDITTVGSGTLISRLLAYLRDAWIAALLGAGPHSEALFVVLQIVNFFRRVLSEGALNSAFVPIWLRLRAGEDGSANAARFTQRVLLVMFCIVGIIALLVIFFAPTLVTAIAPGFDRARRSLAAFLLFMVAPYIVLAGLVAVIAAALNAEGRVRAVAIIMVTFNLTMVTSLALLPRGDADQFYVTAWLAFAVTVAGLIQLALTSGVWLSTGKRWQLPRTHVADQTENFFKRAFPGLIATGVPQLKLIAITAIASASPAAVSWLYYANRLYELPLVSVAIAAVIVPRIAAGVVAGNDHALVAAQSRAYERARCPPLRGLRCLPIPSRAACSSAELSVPRIQRQLRARWPRSVPDCPATCWKRHSAPSRLRTRIRKRRWQPRCVAWLSRLSAGCCYFRATAISVSPRHSRLPAGSEL